MEQNKAPVTEQELSEILQVRRDKLAQLQADGKDPFQITKYPQDNYSADVKEKYSYLEPEQESGEMVCMAGRMMSKRIMGKASFAHIRDNQGDIQLYLIILNQ